MFKQLKTAFTLIELLIVIGVIAILSAGIIIGVRDATRAARETAALVFSTTMKKTMITDMVGEWTFDDETNPGYDSSGKGNNGTLVGPPTWTADGKVRGALEFNGTTDYVSCGNVSELNFERTDAFSGEAWIKAPSGSAGYIMGKMDVTSPNPGWGLRTSSNVLNLYLLNNASTNNYIRVVGSTNVNDDNWHHVCFAYDGSSSASGVKFYVDGGLENVTTPIDGLTVTIQTSISFNIGSRDDGGDSFFTGTIDEVRIYDAVLEVSQIKARYAKGLQKLHAEGKIDGKEYYQRLTETGF